MSAILDDAGLKLLPGGYEDLVPLLNWALETERERHAKRLASTLHETKVLYDAMAPKMDGVIQLLQRFPVEHPLDTPHRRLYLLALSFVEVSIPIELKWPATRNDVTYSTTRLTRPNRF